MHYHVIYHQWDSASVLISFNTEPSSYIHGHICKKKTLFFYPETEGVPVLSGVLEIQNPGVGRGKGGVTVRCHWCVHGSGPGVWGHTEQADTDSAGKIARSGFPRYRRPELVQLWDVLGWLGFPGPRCPGLVEISWIQMSLAGGGISWIQMSCAGWGWIQVSLAGWDFLDPDVLYWVGFSGSRCPWLVKDSWIEMS